MIWKVSEYLKRSPASNCLWWGRGCPWLCFVGSPLAVCPDHERSRSDCPSCPYLLSIHRKKLWAHRPVRHSTRSPPVGQKTRWHSYFLRVGPKFLKFTRLLFTLQLTQGEPVFPVPRKSSQTPQCLNATDYNLITCITSKWWNISQFL